MHIKPQHFNRGLLIVDDWRFVQPHLDSPAHSARKHRAWWSYDYSTNVQATRASKAYLRNWLSFSGRTTGFIFGWVLPKEPVLRVELYIDRGDKDLNKSTLESLAEKKDSIENEIGASLEWDRLEDAQASRISISRPFSFDDPENVREQAKQWAVDMMLKFLDAFQPHIRNF